LQGKTLRFWQGEPINWKVSVAGNNYINLKV